MIFILYGTETYVKLYMMLFDAVLLEHARTCNSIQLVN